MKSTTFETGITDFHKLTTTILQKTISKGNTRDYKAFDENTFETRLKSNLTSKTTIDYLQFKGTLMQI